MRQKQSYFGTIYVWTNPIKHCPASTSVHNPDFLMSVSLNLATRLATSSPLLSPATVLLIISARPLVYSSLWLVPLISHGAYKSSPFPPGVIPPWTSTLLYRPTPYYEFYGRRREHCLGSKVDGRPSVELSVAWNAWTSSSGYRIKCSLDCLRPRVPSPGKGPEYRPIWRSPVVPLDYRTTPPVDSSIFLRMVGTMFSHWVFWVPWDATRYYWDVNDDWMQYHSWSVAGGIIILLVEYAIRKLDEVLVVKCPHRTSIREVESPSP